MQFAKAYLDKLKTALDAIPLPAVTAAYEVLKSARDRDRRIFIVGNGGSAATSSHFAVDLGKGASLGRAKRFKVLSLTDNTPWITALANDLKYEEVFEQQLRNFAEPGDVLLAISASGNSPNILAAVRAGKELGLTTMGWSGFGGGEARRHGRPSDRRRRQPLRPGRGRPLHPHAPDVLRVHGTEGMTRTARP